MYKIIIKKSIVVAVIILFLSINIVPSASTIFLRKYSMLNYNGNTLYVGGTGPGNYTKIQDAIDNASDGDIVFIYSGFYHESIIINKSISVFGEESNTTIIDGNHPPNPKMDKHVSITADNVDFSGFTIEKSVEWDTIGINVFNCSNCQITNNCIRNLEGGIYVRCIDSVIISNNTINCMAYGIGIQEYGLNIFEYTDNLMISNNFISGEGSLPLYGWGILFSPANSTNFIYRNITIFSNTIVETLIGIGFCFFPNHAFYITPVIKDAVIVRNTIKNNVIGIFLCTAKDTVIKENNLQKNLIKAIFINSFHTVWQKNYWNRPRIIPKLIFGEIKIGSKWLPWFNIDWHPAKEPYDI